MITDVTKGTPRSRREVLYDVTFNAVELDLLYALARKACNELPFSTKKPEEGSWAADVIELDKKLTSLFHKRR